MRFEARTPELLTAYRAEVEGVVARAVGQALPPAN
jgi:hypothetical protein